MNAREGRDRMRIGELAEEAGVNVQKIRFYACEGLLSKPARSAKGAVKKLEIAQDRLSSIEETIELLSRMRAEMQGMIRSLSFRRTPIQSVPLRSMASPSASSRSQINLQFGKGTGCVYRTRGGLCDSIASVP